MSKLADLVTSEGFESEAALLEEYGLDSVVPGICMRKDCDYTSSVEPDQTEGWCESCDATTVKSALILAGVI